MQAALGLAQLEKIEEHIVKKREIGLAYDKGLKGIKGFQLPLPHTSYAQNIYWVYGLIANSEELALKTVKHLNEKGIGTRPFFWCMHEQPVFLKMNLFSNERYPNAERLAHCGFYIPSGLGLDAKEIDIIINELIVCGG